MDEAAELAHELTGRGAEFLVVRRRIEIEQDSDAAAHRFDPPGTLRSLQRRQLIGSPARRGMTPIMPSRASPASENEFSAIAIH
jgi:hypothetical protein